MEKKISDEEKASTWRLKASTWSLEEESRTSTLGCLAEARMEVVDWALSKLDANHASIRSINDLLHIVETKIVYAYQEGLFMGQRVARREATLKKPRKKRKYTRRATSEVAPIGSLKKPLKGKRRRTKAEMEAARAA